MRFRLVFLLLTMHLLSSGQQPALYFERITVQNGLSHNKVNCILQDRRGFIWLGTSDGLNRYDGHHFTIFKNEPENKTSISGNSITGILEDREGILWISTSDGGLSKYDYRLPPDQQFTQYKHLPGDSNSIPGNSLNAILEDSQERLWLATTHHSVIIFDKKTGKFSLPVRTGTKGVLSLVRDSYGKIWAGREGGSILKINPYTLRYESDPRYDNLYAKLPHMEVSSLYRDKKNHIWFGSWDRQLYRFNIFTSQEETFNAPTGGFENDDILCFSEDNKGRIWMGGHYNGLQLYDDNTGKFYQYHYDPSREGTIADNRINCIYRDKNGMMWLGTNKGVSISNPVQQQFIQHFLPDNDKSPLSIYNFYENEDKDVLIGTSNGLFIKKKGSDNLTHVPLKYKGQPLAVTCFFKDGNDFYLGTNYTLFKYNPLNQQLSVLPNTDKDKVMSQIIESRVVSVIKDSIEGRPVLLVSPYGHFIAYYDLEMQKWVSRMDSVKNILVNFNLRDNLVHKFYKTRSGEIWMANAVFGLGEWKNNSMPRINYYSNDPAKKNGLSNNHVYDIKEDNLGNLWISTYGGGLHYMDTKTREIVHVPNSPNLLEGLQLDKRGNVWMISNGELYKYDPLKKVFSQINLPDVEKTGGVTGYFSTDSEGNMYVSGLNYFIEFNPDYIQIGQTPSSIWFTDFQVFGHSSSHLLQQKEIVLPYYRNTISISFAAPNYNFSSPARFAYKLEGSNTDWVQADPSGTATYSNLDGGDYVFLVKMISAGNGIGETAHLKIRIIPPYWKRWWFYAICTLTLTLIAWGIYRYRINELVKRQAIRNKIAQDLHDSMGSALSSISIYGRVAQIQHNRNEKELLQEILEKITTTSTDVISEMNDIVWTINPRNDSMEKIIQRMESYAKPLAAAEDISFDLQYDPEILTINLTMEKRKNFYLIFKEAFNNAIKYGKAKKIVTQIRVAKTHVRMVVTDDGKGFDMEKVQTHGHSTAGGNGLTNMVMRAREMRGFCQISSAPGNGTQVTLDFPY